MTSSISKNKQKNELNNPSSNKNEHSLKGTATMDEIPQKMPTKEKPEQKKKKGKPGPKKKKNLTKYQKLRRKINKKYYKKHRKQILKNSKEKREEFNARKAQYYEENPDKLLNVQRFKQDNFDRKKFSKLNKTDPEKAYEMAYLRIMSQKSTVNSRKPEDRIFNDESLEEIIDLIEQSKDLRRKYNRERRKYIKMAWELDIPVKEYIDKIKEIDKKKFAEEKIEQQLHDFILQNASPEQLEVNKRLKELNKTYTPFLPEPENEYEIIKKEIKKEMAKISFDGGKTLLDITNDREFNIILSKVSKMKVWNSIVDKFDTKAMLNALEKMSANERKLCTQANKVENRMIYLGKYLLEAQEDLIL